MTDGSDTRTDGSFYTQRTKDGEEVLLPSDHDERVRAFCVKPMTSGMNHEGSKAILATRYDGELTVDYGTLVATSALQLLFTWMIHDATFFQVTLLSNEIPNMIMAARVDHRALDGTEKTSLADPIDT